MERPMNSMHPEVSKFLSDQPLRLFIDGEWIQAVGGGTSKPAIQGQIGCSRRLQPEMTMTSTKP